MMEERDLSKLSRYNSYRKSWMFTPPKFQPHQRCSLFVSFGTRTTCGRSDLRRAECDAGRQEWSAKLDAARGEWATRSGRANGRNRQGGLDRAGLRMLGIKYGCGSKPRTPGEQNSLEDVHLPYLGDNWY